VPPDYDPKKASTLNAHQGKKHALGKRAKDIDKGILIVRYVKRSALVSWQLSEPFKLTRQIRVALQHMVRHM
jgi:hypothetical protein